MKRKRAATIALAAVTAFACFPAVVPAADDVKSIRAAAVPGKLSAAENTAEVSSAADTAGLPAGESAAPVEGTETPEEKPSEGNETPEGKPSERAETPTEKPAEKTAEGQENPAEKPSEKTEKQPENPDIARPEKVKWVSIASSSQSVIRLKWKPAKNAKRYYVCRASSKAGKYRRIAVCRKTSFTDRSGKAGKTYYYRITAVNQEGKLIHRGVPGRIKSAKVRRKVSRTAYVGDSVMYGFREYGIIRNTASHHVIAKVGVGTYQFVRAGLLNSILSYRPQRMFIMMGVNAIGRRIDPSYETSTIRYYKKIITRCLDRDKEMEIVVASVAPTTAGSSVGLYARQHFNRRVRSMIRDIKASGKYKSCTVKYYDMDPLLGDSSHYLYRSYATGDGIHWQVSVYRKVKKAWDDYAKWW